MVSIQVIYFRWLQSREFSDICVFCGVIDSISTHAGEVEGFDSTIHGVPHQNCLTSPFSYCILFPLPWAIYSEIWKSPVKVLFSELLPSSTFVDDELQIMLRWNFQNVGSPPVELTFVHWFRLICSPPHKVSEALQ